MFKPEINDQWLARHYPSGETTIELYADYCLIESSDGAVHSIPVENLDLARVIDPGLTVL